jgi:hypothetical protein
MVINWLVTHKCDGLCNDEGCGCSINDLGAWCDNIGESCVAAKNVGPKNGFDNWFVPKKEED